MTYQSGQKLGNYRLVRLLGYGGFAKVYLGEHIYLNTQAAIKVLQKQLSEEALEKFLQEARLIAGLKHPHIVGVLEFGIEEQHPYLVMAYAPHGTLRRRYAKSKPLSPTLIVPHVRQVADALYYAHQHKIIHRDVKPENMLLDDDNTVLLSDFGLAMKVHSTSHSIHSTDSAGTTTYMAPEQLEGKPSAASDQYALGVVMYEWLCGCLPFDGPDMSVVVRHLHVPPAPLREHVPTLSKEIEAVVLKALEKDPKRRFATVQELATAFEEACKDMPVPDNAPLSLAGMQYREATLSTEVTELSQESSSNWLVEFPLNPTYEKRDGGVPAALLEPALLQAPSLNVSTRAWESIVDTPAPSASQHKRHLSRRTMLAGLAGLGVLASGVGIWRLSAKGLGTQVPRVQGDQRSVGTHSTATGQTPGTGTAHVDGRGTGEKSTANSLGADKNGKKPGISTPTTSSNGTPAGATSTPDVTPATHSSAAQSVALTVQMYNVPSTVQNRTTAHISVKTNMETVSFQFYAVYYGLKNQSSSSQAPLDVINGTTNDSGIGSVSWKPSLLSSQIISGTHGDLYVVATDKHGNAIYSQYVRIPITSGWSGS
jgi:serine/threonine protein kinase